MKTISVQNFCGHHNISVSFIDSLSNFELVDILIIEKTKHIRIDDINRIERLIRIHHELDVNLEGLDIINNLIEEVNQLKGKVNELQNKLDFYE